MPSDSTNKGFDTLGRLADRVAPKAPELVRHQAVVVAVGDGTVDIQVGGSHTTIPGVSCLGSYNPMVGDNVWVDFKDDDPLVLGVEGPPDGSPGGSGGGCGKAGPQPEPGTEIATGDYSCAEGWHSEARGQGAHAIGNSNKAGTDGCIAAGGFANIAGVYEPGSDPIGVLCTAIGGQDNISKGDYGALIGGQLNIVDEGGTQAFVAGGNANVANGQNTAVVGGDTNLADAVGASVLAGTSNTSSSEYSAVVSGTSNNIHDGSENVGIIGGHANEVGGGSEEFANGNNSVIVGGDTNIILNGFNSVILGGSDNLIDDGGAGSVVTGQNHVVRQDNCFATGNNHTLDVDSGANGVAVGEFNRITDNAEAAFAEGSGACAWFSTQHAFAFSAVIGPADEFDARPYRSFAQGSYTSSYATTPGDGITVPVFSLIFPDLKYMVAIEATVVALGQAGTDVAATYKVSATIVIKGDDTTTAGRFVGTPVVTTIVADTEAAGWTVTPRLTMTDFTNDTFEIGVNSTELYAANWAVTINMCEVLGDAGF